MSFQCHNSLKTYPHFSACGPIFGRSTSFSSQKNSYGTAMVPQEIIHADFRT